LVRPQIHDVAFALGADQFQGQKTADGRGRGNPRRTRLALPFTRKSVGAIAIGCL